MPNRIGVLTFALSPPLLFRVIGGSIQPVSRSFKAAAREALKYARPSGKHEVSGRGFVLIFRLLAFGRLTTRKKCTRARTRTRTHVVMRKLNDAAWRPMGHITTSFKQAEPGDEEAELVSDLHAAEQAADAAAKFQEIEQRKRDQLKRFQADVNPPTSDPTQPSSSRLSPDTDNACWADVDFFTRFVDV